MVRLCAFGRTERFSIAHLYHQNKPIVLSIPKNDTNIKMMTTKMKTLQLTLIALLITSLSFSQGVFTRIDSLIKEARTKNPTISFSVGFVNNNTEFYTSYGALSLESTTKVDKNTTFEIASITKILTSNLIAQAALKNQLKLDDFIDNYLPKQYQLQKELQQKVRISDLASHQSGLPDIDFRALIMANPQQPTNAVTKTTLTSLINQADALLDYGNYRYSTMNYVLMGQILEEIYDKSYAEILEDNIINPLKMKRTFTTKFSIENKVTGYNPEGGTQAFFDWNIVASAGLVKSNANDMIQYLKAVLASENNISNAALLTEMVFYNKDKRQMGLGLNIINDAENTVFVKTGDSMGQSCLLGYDRKNNWGIVFFINQRNHKLRQTLFNEIYEILKK